MNESRSSPTPTKAPPPESETLDGVVERIIYHNPETAYTVARFVPDGAEESTVIVGTLPAATPGEALRLKGKWTQNPAHGRQFEFGEHAPVLPGTVLGIEKYLGSGLVKGIGPVLAKRLVSKFGAETLEVLDREPERLREVAGIGPKRVDDIARAWTAQSALRETMVFLQGIGVSVTYAARLTRLHGPETARLVKQDPYRLLLDVRGLGFKSVDKIAEKMGIARDAQVRLRAGLEHALDHFVEEGHAFAPLGELLDEAEHLLGASREALDEALAAVAAEQRVILDTEPSGRRVVYPARLHRAEQAVAFRFAQLITTRRPLLSGDLGARLARFETEFKFHFAAQQRTALLTALQGGVAVITGGPGTGKTTLLRALLRMLEGTETRALLCSPTGRAAKRMSQAARRQAQTIHRLLQYSPAVHRFARNGDNPLAADLVVVDEVSMLDLPLAADLLEAIPPGCALLLIGDADQLPAVGPGNVLRDLVECGRAPVIRLSEIFRQARRSAIVHNAHRINRGEFPYLPKTEEQRQKSDLFFVEKHDPGEAVEAIKALVQERIPSRFGLDSVRDIQVIAPMRRGSLGVINLNAELQALLNRDSHPLFRAGRLWKRGDKVMQISNNYDKDVYNGDLGLIAKIDPEEQFLTVRFDHRVVDYGFDELDELELAYAITIHKSQGSEFPAVVIPIHGQHHVMLQRNLLYTAITRGRRLVTIVGTKQALARAVREARQSQRLSGLVRRLAALLA
jgi:exodeoxyribonuclease V alpha subunit